MPLFRETLNLQLPIRSQFKASSSLPLIFLMGRVFLTIFNKKREINKKKSLLGKNTQFLKSCIWETAGRTTFA
jgi:hypothetical protein